VIAREEQFAWDTCMVMAARKIGTPRQSLSQGKVPLIQNIEKCLNDQIHKKGDLHAELFSSIRTS
jgi:hypothetical protein